jgi:ornithine cyclodeaminase/alanine dehydrogenase-like protein (mu-crystallin family)
MAIILSEADVKAVLPMPDLIDAMEAALAKFSAGEVLQPVRTVLQVGPSKAFFGLMPAYQPAPAALGAKLVTVFAANAARGLPTHLATIVLLDPETGALTALLDGRFITEARTAAVSAVSVRHMARAEAKEKTRLAIIGSGVQARSHLEAFALVCCLTDVRVWSPTAASRERFAREMAPHAAAPIRVADSARDAMDDANVIVLATASPVPVVESGWIADGAHICAVGACRPDVREMDGGLVAAARLIVDSRAGALAEAGDVVLAMKEGRFDATHIAGELGEVVAARVAGRTSEREVTIFKSLGMAVEDVAAAELAWRRAAETGLGRAILL